MISYGLKLWSNNTDLFRDARDAHARRAFDFIELFFNPQKALDPVALNTLKDIPITIHATHTGKFHEFVLGDDELAIWRDIVALADEFGSSTIVVHPGSKHTLPTFMENLARIDDPRIRIENMAGLDASEYPMFATTLDELERIRQVKPICFDLEKAVKASRYLNVPYREYITDAIKRLGPDYFHISGGDPESPFDEHRDLWGCAIDFPWMKRTLLNIPGDISLVFETPKGAGIANDLDNMEYFRSL